MLTSFLREATIWITVLGFPPRGIDVVGYDLISVNICVRLLKQAMPRWGLRNEAGRKSILSSMWVITLIIVIFWPLCVYCDEKVDFSGKEKWYNATERNFCSKCSSWCWKEVILYTCTLMLESSCFVWVFEFLPIFIHFLFVLVVHKDYFGYDSIFWFTAILVVFQLDSYFPTNLSSFYRTN